MALHSRTHVASVDEKSGNRGGSGNQKLVRPIAAPNPFQKMHKNIRINCIISN